MSTNFDISLIYRIKDLNKYGTNDVVSDYKYS